MSRVSGVDGKWTLSDETTAFEANGLSVTSFKATLPDESEQPLSVVKNGGGTVGTVVSDPEKGILLLWRYQIVDAEWGWQLPLVTAESIKFKDEAAAAVEAQTGWKPGPVTKLISWLPAPQFFDSETTVFWTEGPTWVGPGPDKNLVSDMSWLNADQVVEQITSGKVTDGTTLTALLLCLSTGRIKPTSN